MTRNTSTRQSIDALCNGFAQINVKGEDRNQEDEKEVEKEEQKEEKDEDEDEDDDDPDYDPNNDDGDGDDESDDEDEGENGAVHDAQATGTDNNTHAAPHAVVHTNGPLPQYADDVREAEEAAGDTDTGSIVEEADNLAYTEVHSAQEVVEIGGHTELIQQGSNDPVPEQPVQNPEDDDVDYGIESDSQDGEGEAITDATDTADANQAPGETCDPKDYGFDDDDEDPYIPIDGAVDEPDVQPEPMAVADPHDVRIRRREYQNYDVSDEEEDEFPTTSMAVNERSPDELMADGTLQPTIDDDMLSEDQAHAMDDASSEPPLDMDADPSEGTILAAWENPQHFPLSIPPEYQLTSPSIPLRAPIPKIPVFDRRVGWLYTVHDEEDFFQIRRGGLRRAPVCHCRQTIRYPALHIHPHFQHFLLWQISYTRNCDACPLYKVRPRFLHPPRLRRYHDRPLRSEKHLQGRMRAQMRRAISAARPRPPGSYTVSRHKNISNNIFRTIIIRFVEYTGIPNTLTMNVPVLIIAPKITVPQEPVNNSVGHHSGAKISLSTVDAAGLPDYVDETENRIALTDDHRIPPEVKRANYEYTYHVSQDPSDAVTTNWYSPIAMSRLESTAIKPSSKLIDTSTEAVFRTGLPGTQYSENEPDAPAAMAPVVKNPEVTSTVVTPRSSMSELSQSAKLSGNSDPAGPSIPPQSPLQSQISLPELPQPAKSSKELNPTEPPKLPPRYQNSLLKAPRLLLRDPLPPDTPSSGSQESLDDSPAPFKNCASPVPSPPDGPSPRQDLLSEVPLSLEPPSHPKPSARPKSPTKSILPSPSERDSSRRTDTVPSPALKSIGKAGCAVPEQSVSKSPGITSTISAQAQNNLPKSKDAATSLAASATSATSTATAAKPTNLIFPTSAPAKINEKLSVQPERIFYESLCKFLAARKSTKKANPLRGLAVHSHNLADHLASRKLKAARVLKPLISPVNLSIWNRRRKRQRTANDA